jgi:hypothetical protein
MADQGHGADRLEHPVHGVEDRHAGRPVVGLAEGHQPERTELQLSETLGAFLYPAQTREARLLGPSSTFGQHAGVGIDSDALVECRCQLEGQRTGAAADVEQAATSMQSQLPPEDGQELTGVGRPAHHVVRRSLAEHVGHRRQLVGPTSSGRRSWATMTVPSN